MTERAEADVKFTKIAVGLLTNARDLVDWGVEGGHTTADQLRLTVSARKEAVARLREQGLSVREIAAITGAPKSTIHDDLSETGQISSETGQASKRAGIREKNANLAKVSTAIPRDTFETIVLDPPWPMTKIERDVRPNQVEFDYPTMTEPRLREFAATIEAMAYDDCHLFMWTTQKFLPLGMELVIL